jgi:hypothetical protein
VAASPLAVPAQTAQLAQQGAEGSDFFVVMSGVLSCTVRKDPTNTDEPLREVLRMSAGHHFGERQGGRGAGGGRLAWEAGRFVRVWGGAMGVAVGLL